MTSIKTNNQRKKRSMKNTAIILFAVALCLGAYAIVDLPTIDAAASQNAIPADCQNVNGQQWAEIPNGRPGVTEYEQCYVANPNVNDGPLTDPYCIQGYAWWTEGTTTSWVFCNDDTTSVVFYR